MEGSMRYRALDTLRGFAMAQMLVFHFLYDLKYMTQAPMDWYGGRGVYFWQQEICWLFVVISGISWNLGRRRAKRGLLVFAMGAVVSLVTWTVMPAERIFFGVLSFLGASMLCMIPLEKLLRRFPAWRGLGTSLLLFFFTRPVSRGYLGFFGRPLVVLPEAFYRNWLSAALGFPFPGFYSSDYVPMLPGIFMFCAGYFLWRLLRGRKERFLDFHLPVLEEMGRNSLWIYMLHQPVLYLLALTAAHIWMP